MNVEEQVQLAEDKGYNCCQTVVSVFSKEFNIDEGTFLRIASGFGGGMKKGEVCGAFTGALMVLGLKYGDNPEAMGKITEEAIRRFEENNDTIICKELLGYDVSIEEENKIIIDQDLKAKYCPKLKVDGIRIVNELK